MHGEDAQWPDEIRAAAVRELFEEVGILLARRAARFARDADCRAVRSLVESGATFTEALGRRGLEPAFDRLVLFARWITPARLSRRYDARFFFARLPGGSDRARRRRARSPTGCGSRPTAPWPTLR